MRDVITLVFFVLVLFAMGCKQKPTEFRDEFRWIAGKWQGKNGSVILMEQWKWNKTRYEGHGYEIEHGDTVFSERLYLQSFDGSYAYIAYLPKFGLTLFNARKEADGYWVFENKDHDFPSQIHYKADEDRSITISLFAKGEPFRGEHSYQLERIK